MADAICRSTNLWWHRIKIRNNQTNRWRSLIVVEYACLCQAVASRWFYVRFDSIFYANVTDCPMPTGKSRVANFVVSRRGQKLSLVAKKAKKIKSRKMFEWGRQQCVRPIILFVVAKSLFGMRLQCPSEFPSYIYIYIYRVRNFSQLYEEWDGFCDRRCRRRRRHFIS